MTEKNGSGNTVEWPVNGITADQLRIMYVSTCFTLLFFGVIGNIFSLIVWSRGTRCKNLQCAMFFKILALSDMIVLIICVGLVISLLYLIEKIPCKLLVAMWFAQELGPQISPWIIVSLSAERALSMMIPLKFTGHSSKRRALISFGCIMVVLVLLQFIWLFSVHFENSQDCRLTAASIIELATRIKYLKIVVLCAVPLVFIIVCKALIAIRLFRMRKMGSATNESQRNRRFATFTILTFVTGILHCISVTPTVIFYIAVADASNAISGETISQKWYWSIFSNILLWIFLQQIFMYVNSSFNFYFYCLAGRDFRADLKDILCCRNRNATRTNNGVTYRNVLPNTKTVRSVL